MAQALIQGNGIVSFDSTDFPPSTQVNYIEKDYTATDAEQEPTIGKLSFVGSAMTSNVAKGKTFYNTDLHSTETGTLEISATGTPNQVEFGKTFYNNVGGLYAKQVGTLTFSGNASASDVAVGKTFYNTDLHTPITGTMAFSGNANASDVMSGNTYYSTDIRTKNAGSMAYNSPTKTTIYANTTHTIPSGYHTGSGSVYEATAYEQTAISTSPATAAKIWSGKTAYVNGSIITGTGTVASVSDLKATGNGADVTFSWTFPANSFYSGLLICAGTSYITINKSTPTIDNYTAIVKASTKSYVYSTSASSHVKVYFKVRPYVYVNGVIQYGSVSSVYAGSSTCSKYSCSDDCDCESDCGCDSHETCGECGPGD